MLIKPAGVTTNGGCIVQCTVYNARRSNNALQAML